MNHRIEKIEGGYRIYYASKHYGEGYLEIDITGDTLFLTDELGSNHAGFPVLLVPIFIKVLTKAIEEAK